jgi:hypothetical protein
MAEFIQCPNCQAVWTLEEIEDSQCGCCGYPDNEDDQNEFDPDYIGPDDPEPDEEGFRGNEAQNYESERMHYIQHNLK